MEKTQENMEMIQELISLNLDSGLERTKKRSQRVTMLLARTNFDSMVDENGDKLRPKKFIEVRNMKYLLKHLTKRRLFRREFKIREKDVFEAFYE